MTAPRRDAERRILMVTGLLVTLFILIGVRPAWAIPAWARQYKISCTFCHSAWPALNAEGRDFKMRGFRFADEGDDLAISDSLNLGPNLPASVRLVMRPFDKTRDGTVKLRAAHEVEVFFAGPVARNFSVFGELEAEDEDEFNVFVDGAVMGWHPTEEANVAMGWAAPFWADPFNTLADGGRRLTRSHKGPLDQRFAARERLRSASQWIGFYGRAGGRVFYNTGVNAGGDDPEGEDAKDVFGRVMVEAVPGVNIGGFVLNGTNETQAIALDFYRAGFDVQVERGGFNVYGMVLRANDDLLAGGDVGNTVGYVEGFYPFEPSGISIPMLVPLVRVDFLDEFTDLTANFNFYVQDNIKAYLEWWQNLDTPAGLRKDNRVTVQVDFAF